MQEKFWYDGVVHENTVAPVAGSLLGEVIKTGEMQENIVAPVGAVCL